MDAPAVAGQWPDGVGARAVPLCVARFLKSRRDAGGAVRMPMALSQGYMSRLSRAAIGMRQPVPNARSVTLSPGAACLRLNSAARTIFSTR